MTCKITTLIFSALGSPITCLVIVASECVDHQTLRILAKSIKAKKHFSVLNWPLKSLPINLVFAEMALIFANSFKLVHTFNPLLQFFD